MSSWLTSQWRNDKCFRPRFCTVRPNWAGDNLGWWDEFCCEWCLWCRIDRWTCWPAVQRTTTGCPLWLCTEKSIIMLPLLIHIVPAEEPGIARVSSSSSNPRPLHYHPCLPPPNILLIVKSLSVHWIQNCVGNLNPFLNNQVCAVHESIGPKI